NGRRYKMVDFWVAMAALCAFGMAFGVCCQYRLEFLLGLGLGIVICVVGLLLALLGCMPGKEVALYWEMGTYVGSRLLSRMCVELVCPQRRRWLEEDEYVAEVKRMVERCYLVE